MHFKKSLKNKSLVFWSILLLIIASALMHTDTFLEDQLPISQTSLSGVIRLNFYRAEGLFNADQIFKNSSVDNKWVKYSKKFQRLIDGNDDHEIYVKTIQYASYTEHFLKINYETPFFISQQHSFLFRLTFF